MPSVPRPLAYDSKTAAASLCLTEAEFLELVRAGSLPAGRAFGSKELWSFTELEALLKGAMITDDFEV